jgi:hypothetical protein
MGVSRSSVLNIPAAEWIELVRCSRQWGKPFVAPKPRLRIIAALKANPNALQVARKVRRKFDTVWRIAQEEGIELSQGRAAYQKRCAKITAVHRARRAHKAQQTTAKAAGQIRLKLPAFRHR